MNDIPHDEDTELDIGMDPLHPLHLHEWELEISQGKLVSINRQGEWEAEVHLSPFNWWMVSQALERVEDAPEDGYWKVQYQLPFMYEGAAHQHDPQLRLGRRLYRIDVSLLANGLDRIREEQHTWLRFVRHIVRRTMDRRFMSAVWSDRYFFNRMGKEQFLQMERYLKDQGEDFQAGVYRGRACPVRGRPFMITQRQIYVCWPGFVQHPWRDFLDVQLGARLMLMLRDELSPSFNAMLPGQMQKPAYLRIC